MKKVYSLFLGLFFVLLSVNGSNATSVTLAWDSHPDPAVAGYKLYYGLSPRNYVRTVDVGKVERYTLADIAEGVNIYFAVTAYDERNYESAFSDELECFSIVPAPAVNGTINPSTAVVLSRGMSQNFTFTPSPNYTLTGVTVDGTAKGAVLTFLFSNVSGNHTIAATFTMVVIGNPSVEMVDDTGLNASVLKIITAGAPPPVFDTNYEGTGENALIFSGISDTSTATYQLSLVSLNYKLQDFYWNFKILKPYNPSSTAKKTYFSFSATTKFGPRTVYYKLSDDPDPLGSSTSIVYNIGSYQEVYNNGFFREIRINLSQDIAWAQPGNEIISISTMTFYVVGTGPSLVIM